MPKLEVFLWLFIDWIVALRVARRPKTLNIVNLEKNQGNHGIGWHKFTPTHLDRVGVTIFYKKVHKWEPVIFQF